VSTDEEIDADKVDGDWITLLAGWFGRGSVIAVEELPFSATLPWGGPSRPWQNEAAWGHTDVDRQRFLAEVTDRFGPGA
jgi:hypothetical protein